MVNLTRTTYCNNNIFSCRFFISGLLHIYQLSPSYFTLVSHTVHSFVLFPGFGYYYYPFFLVLFLLDILKFLLNLGLSICDDIFLFWSLRWAVVLITIFFCLPFFFLTSCIFPFFFICGWCCNIQSSVAPFLLFFLSCPFVVYIELLIIWNKSAKFGP